MVTLDRVGFLRGRDFLPGIPCFPQPDRSSRVYGQAITLQLAVGKPFNWPNHGPVGLGESP